MIVPISWLNEYIDGPTDAQELAEKFTFIGYMLDHPVYQVGDDYILDLEVRQNRSDCLSLIGLARELGAVIDKHVMMPQMLDLSNVSSGKTKINIENAELCYRFNTLTISNIENKQSPDWMKKKLESYGIKSINALVDITNYVMIELGQPLHAFDAHKISNKELTIRTARENETITLLGNKSVNLTQDDLIIADASGPIAIAGIMGGDEKGISESTTEIILEAATYSQANIRRSTIRHDIRTEASTRLEKFLHPDLTELALSRAAQLIKDVIGGEIVDHSDQYPHHFEEKTIDMRLSQLERLTGITFETKIAQHILEKLDIKTELKNDELFSCQIPYFRTDLEQEVDLIEEVIRIHGYDKIPAFPLSGGTPADIQSHAFSLEEKIKDLLVAMGYDEIITEPLVNETHSQHEPVLLENSLTAEKTMLRTTLEFSIIRALNEHKKHSLNVIKLFEIGKIYYRSHDEYVEERHLTTILWSTDTIDLRSAKGDIELLLERCGYVYTDSLVSMKYIDSKTLYMDLNLDQLMLQKENAREKVIAAPLQNIIKEDFSVSTHGETSGIAQLLEKIKELDSIIYAAELTQGPTKLENGSYNSLITISFYSADISLTKGDVEPLREKVLKLIESID